MKITPSSNKAIFGITGHAGAGHVHSHSGFIQDDSAGFAVSISLIEKAYPCDLTIVKVTIDNGTISVFTQDGGMGKAVSRRGVTPYEFNLMQNAIGSDARFSQSIALRAFGRIYGQGVLEAPVSFQTAVCLAVINTFKKKYPNNIPVFKEGIRCNVGACLGTTLAIDNIDVAVMAVLNATRGGIGPVEDQEGNLNFYSKGQLMDTLGIENIPTIVLESKAYIPSISDSLDTPSFLVRYNKEMDNPAVGKALSDAIRKDGLPLIQSDTAYPRYSGEMREITANLGRRICDIGRQLECAKKSSDKVRLIGELAILISQDAGGVSYMTEELHEIVAGGGLIPGTAAVLSMAVDKLYIKQNVIPEFTKKDCSNYISIVVNAIKILSENIEKAKGYLSRKKEYNKDSIEKRIS
ncbi:MAG: hypothetical protein HUN05_22455 [Desulfobacter sp.]|nr:MAG: hypothetical protein HUN05_22455 [Desulfobacter sp.]